MVEDGLTMRKRSLPALSLSPTLLSPIPCLHGTKSAFTGPAMDFFMCFDEYFREKFGLFNFYCVLCTSYNMKH